MAWHSVWSTQYWAVGNYDSQNVLDNALAANAYINKEFKRSKHNARVAVIANLCLESTGINPGQWEGGGNYDPSSGFGIAQWTPSTKFTDWLGSTDPTDMQDGDKQMEYLTTNDAQWRGDLDWVDEHGYCAYYDLYVPIIRSLSDFFYTAGSLEDMTTAWMVYWERPLVGHEGLQQRIFYAEYFDQLLPDRFKRKEKYMPIWMYPCRRKPLNV